MDDFGQHIYNGAISTPLYDSFRSNLMTMKEGERRRVWVPNRRDGGFWVADLHLSRVYRTDAKGEPIITNEPSPGCA